MTFLYAKNVYLTTDRLTALIQLATLHLSTGLLANVFDLIQKFANPFKCYLAKTNIHFIFYVLTLGIYCIMYNPRTIVFIAYIFYNYYIIIYHILSYLMMFSSLPYNLVQQHE